MFSEETSLTLFRNDGTEDEPFPKNRGSAHGGVNLNTRKFPTEQKLSVGTAAPALSNHSSAGPQGSASHVRRKEDGAAEKFATSAAKVTFKVAAPLLQLYAGHT